MTSEATYCQSWSRNPTNWVWAILVLILTITAVTSEDDGGKCDSLTVLEPSARPPMDGVALKADIEKTQKESPTTSTTYVLNYAGCALLGDREALSGAVTDITALAKTDIEIERLKSMTSYTMRKQECPKWIPALQKSKRKILPDSFDGDTPRSLQELLEYLSNPDFRYNICRTTNITAFPLCVEEVGCGYLKASAIDYAPEVFGGFIQNTCKYILQGISVLEEDSNFWNEFPLVELRKDCGNPDFFHSFQCLSVNVTLRQKLKMYADWYLENREGKLSPHLENLRLMLKGEITALLMDLSKRFHYNITKEGDDCSGSIDFQAMWNRTMNYFHDPPDGTFPFDFLRAIPIDEKKIVALLQKTCDVSQDLVCGQGCICTCPKGDEHAWRSCNGRGGKASAWNYFTLICISAISILIMLCIA